jgi:hypothetical protein
LVVSPEVTAARLRRLDRCVQRLRRLAAMPLDTYLADEDAQALAERHLHVAVQVVHRLLGRLDDLVALARALDEYARRAGAAPS